jgi:hypothetical protein
MANRLREQLGVWLKDRLRYERRLRSRSRAYLGLANRYERLEEAPDGSGYACCWQYTSKLHAPGVHPDLAIRLLRRCLDDAPIDKSDTPRSSNESPRVSVLIGHRGTERLPLLLATIETFAAQQDVPMECLIIEQDTCSRIADRLPAWVRHIHAPLQDPTAPYNRSQTFNIGAGQARAPVLLLHDNDMLVPKGYLRRILQRIDSGYSVVNPKRFIFYLNREHSKQLLSGRADYDSQPPEAIVQNLEAGGSMAITLDAFEEIGGMDEGFTGWGGEDNEFWDRCLTLPTWIWGYDPIVHLWHKSQPLKGTEENPNLSRCREIMRYSPQERIQRLRAAPLSTIHIHD